MNLLDDINISLEPTGENKKLRIQGKTTVFEVYRVPIKNLIYNKKNGRIATYVSKFIEDGNEFSNDKEALNNEIEKFIEESNPDALKKTKESIKTMSQTEPAVVTADGIVLDGNRRFTSLRQLSREELDPQYEYLNAVVLPANRYSDKDIKRLELNLQHAVESKVDYNPIDRLVDIYRDLIENKEFTPEEYAKETQSTPNKVKSEMRIAGLVVEYLEYINQPKHFYIAREQKIDGPVREVDKILRSKKIDVNRIDDIKDALFAAIATIDGDTTRRIRGLKDVFEGPIASEKFLNKLDDEEILDDFNDSFNDAKKQEEARQTGIVNLESDLRSKFVDVVETTVESKKLSNAENKPVTLLNQAFNKVSEIDFDSVERMDDKLKGEFKTLLNKISVELEKLGNL